MFWIRFPDRSILFTFRWSSWGIWWRSLLWQNACEFACQKKREKRLSCDKLKTFLHYIYKENNIQDPGRTSSWNVDPITLSEQSDSKSNNPNISLQITALFILKASLTYNSTIFSMCDTYWNLSFLYFSPGLFLIVPSEGVLVLFHCNQAPFLNFSSDV